jgi:hypothetical protein
VRVLRDDGRTLAQDDGRLPRRRKEAAAPRREVAGGGTDQGPGYPTDPITSEDRVAWEEGRLRSLSNGQWIAGRMLANLIPQNVVDGVLRVSETNYRAGHTAALRRCAQSDGASPQWQGMIHD